MKLERLPIIQPFFNDHDRTDMMIRSWSKWSQEVRDKVEVIIVDDHSTKSPPVFKETGGANVRVYRIKDNLGYGTPAALNLGFHVAFNGIDGPKYPWAMCMDTDCTFDNDYLEKLFDTELSTEKCRCKCSKCLADRNTEKRKVGMKLCHPPHHWYQFCRRRVGPPELIPTGRKARWRNRAPLGCALLISSHAFHLVNGFDEDFCGKGYGFFDNHFTGKLEKMFGNPCHFNRRVIVTEHMMESSQLRNSRAKDIERYAKRRRDINKKIIRAKEKNEMPGRSSILDFKWKRIQ